MSKPLLDALGKTILVGSGGIGTRLRRGDEAAGPVEWLNVIRPDAVTDLHRRYVEAGSQIVVTNTFAANPLTLAAAGLADRCAEINRAGVRLAREAAGAAAEVWASVGPLSLGLQLDDFDAVRLRAVYAEQVDALQEADAIVLETFVDPREAEAALDAVAGAGRPFIFQIGNPGAGRTQWERIDALMRLAQQHGALAVGTNCRHPNDILRTVEFLAVRTRLPISASANAGHPRIDRGWVRYEFTPEAFRELGEKLAARGAAVIGGCCGTTPEHINALAAAVRDKPVAPRGAVEVHEAVAAPRAPPPPAAENGVRRLMRSPRFVVSVEIRADRRAGLDEIVESARHIAAAGADMFDVPDNPSATVGRDAMVVAARLQEATTITAVPHLAVTQSNLLRLHSSLIGCWDLGLRGVLAITGDPPAMGPLGGMVSRVADVKSSVELLRLIRSLREGKTIDGEEVVDPPDLCAGCALGVASPAQINWLRKKGEAGAEFVLSQPVFDLDAFRRLRDAAGAFPMRFFPGLMPLTGRKNAEFFAAGRVPGIRVPPAAVEGFARFESAADQRKYGLEQATRLAVAVAAEARGLYLIMPFGRSKTAETVAIVRALRRVAP